MVPENCPYAALSRTFRVFSRPSRIGTWDYDQVFVCNFITIPGGLYLKTLLLQGKLPNMNTITYIFINSGIQTFRKPYAALSRPVATAAKHTHISISADVTRILKALRFRTTPISLVGQIGCEI